ncbi:hypothetical protein KDA_01970 [Dictyobacter alpinus]|uniref:Prenyltransferase n=1 Tax=Dictyobacter alpinus TaxID=2014873 RepID=A0A402B035_9CHLR|nr:hypothetical protein [Dictyobacter alpinus]GCE24713.1 hypothetical protein KDA_01970 [Dictyobacter alpinus]
MRYLQQLFQHSKTYLLPGMFAPVVIGTLLAWQTLTFLRWWPFTCMLVINISLFVLLYGYLLPRRTAFAAHKHGWISMLLVCCSSILLLSTAYLLQVGNWNVSILLAGVPMGLYTTIVFYCQHYGTQQIGPNQEYISVRKLRLIGAGLTSLIAFAIVLDCLAGIYPWYAGIAILTTFPVLLTLLRIGQDRRNILHLRITTSGAYVKTALLFALALLIHGFIGV